MQTSGANSEQKHYEIERFLTLNERIYNTPGNSPGAAAPSQRFFTR